MDFTDAIALAPWLADQAVVVTMGLALAATCGLRAFLPLLVINLLGLTGRVEFAESFAFMADWPATLLFGTATLAELAGDKFPGFDHLMDASGVIVRPTCATIAAATMITGFDPLVATTLGLIVGGGAAGVVQVGKANLRLASTTFTGGIGNVVISLGEDAAAFGGVTLAVVAPIVFGGGALFLFSMGAVLVAMRHQRRSLRALALA